MAKNMIKKAQEDEEDKKKKRLLPLILFPLLGAAVAGGTTAAIVLTRHKDPQTDDKIDLELKQSEGSTIETKNEPVEGQDIVIQYSVDAQHQLDSFNITIDGQPCDRDDYIIDYENQTITINGNCVVPGHKIEVEVKTNPISSGSYMTVELEGDKPVTLCYASKTATIMYKTSIDGEAKILTDNLQITTQNKSLYLYGENGSLDDLQLTFEGEGKVNITGGSIMNLIYGDSIDAGEDLTAIPSGISFSGIFQNSTALKSVPHNFLPATTLSESCYRSLFQGCTSLITTPNLPAVVLTKDCYASMFQGCTSLVHSPIMLATELANSCCREMFHNCSSLIDAPQLMGAELKEYCYAYMFNGCFSLKINTESGSKIFTCEEWTGEADKNPVNEMFAGTDSFITTPEINTTYYWTIK